jgi:nucleotide-binding universal stress UspA family protein
MTLRKQFIKRMKTYEIKKVLVPIDFSSVSLNALKTAVAICKRQSATLTLIRIVESPYTLFPVEPGFFYSDFLPELVNRANKNLAELANELRMEYNLEVNHVVQFGSPAEEICSWAYDKNFDLIVMGTPETSDLRELVIGSNAFRIVKKSPCPVMTIPPGHEWLDFVKILFPIRKISQALDKYDTVRPIIKRNKSSLLLAGVVKKNDSTAFLEMNVLVDRVRRKITEDDVICESEVYYCDNVARQVLDIAELEKPDLIVITAAPDTSKKQFSADLYTRVLVNHAHFPVMSVRPKPSGENTGFLESFLKISSCYSQLRHFN